MQQLYRNIIVCSPPTGIDTSSIEAEIDKTYGTNLETNNVTSTKEGWKATELSSVSFPSDEKFPLLQLNSGCDPFTGKEEKNSMELIPFLPKNR